MFSLDVSFKKYTDEKKILNQIFKFQQFQIIHFKTYSQI